MSDIKRTCPDLFFADPVSVTCNYCLRDVCACLQEGLDYGMLVFLGIVGFRPKCKHRIVDYSLMASFSLFYSMLVYMLKWLSFHNLPYKYCDASVEGLL